MVTGKVPAGVTAAHTEQILVALVREEHAAANPGSGVTGFLDAYAAFEELNAALTALKRSEAKAAGGLVGVLEAKINVLGKLWVDGPPPAGFFSTTASEASAPPPK